MSTHLPIVSRRAALGLASLLALSRPLVASRPAYASEKAGTVKVTRGVVTASAAGAERPLKPGESVFVGDVVKTLADGFVQLELGARTKLSLAAGSALRIDRYLADAGGEFELIGGALKFERTGPPASDPLQIKSAYGLIAVRGTRFYAGPSKDKFGVFVDEGRVQMSGGGASVSVGPGEGTDFDMAGSAPSTPVQWKPPRIAALKALFE